MKVETGRVKHPEVLDDFFACTLVVKNTIEIKNAEKLVKKFFKIQERKPRSDSYTHKNPDSFPYDDLRLYVKLKPSEDLPPEHSMNKLSEIVFEFQIKTFLQHAWSIATHDLVYKGDEIDWATQRVSFQIKAMLEHAEVSIREIDRIKTLKVLSKQNKNVRRLNHIKDLLTGKWPKEHLPKDLIRLSKNILHVLDCLKIDVEELGKLLDEESKVGRGTSTLNLSPYFIILQTIINRDPAKVQGFFSSNSTVKTKLVVPSELELGELVLNEEKVIRL